AIGAGEQVVAVDDFSDYPPDVEGLPRLGGLINPNYEQIVAMDPDVFIITTGAEEIVARLEELNIPVLVLKHERFDDVYANIRLLGQLTGHTREAAEVVSAIEDRVAAVQQAVGDVPPERRPRVFYEVWPEDPLMTAGPGSFIHDLIGLAGGINVASDVEQAWAPINLEDVVARNPQVIITPFQESYEQLRSGERPGWAGIDAVVHGRIYLIDQNLISRPGPRLVEALEAFAGWLHPDAFRR
ncbi:MAG TPA: helical backbone metal receptor, partial [Bacillota bacterium]